MNVMIKTFGDGDSIPSGLYIISTLRGALTYPLKERQFFLVFIVMANDTCTTDNSVLISIMFVQI